MTDIFDLKKRSKIMRAIRGRDTRPEMTVRRLIHGMGYRYRLHDPMLPGRPDLVFPSRKKIIFVHGCFWHRHSCRKGQSTPTTRAHFWSEKFARNEQRDARIRRTLRQDGWQVLVVWECQIQPSKARRLVQRLERFLG